jgi:hypothetical protein
VMNRIECVVKSTDERAKGKGQRAKGRLQRQDFETRSCKIPATCRLHDARGLV